jgi:hypothetical protein
MNMCRKLIEKFKLLKTLQYAEVIMKNISGPLSTMSARQIEPYRYLGFFHLSSKITNPKTGNSQDEKSPKHQSQSIEIIH